MIDTIRQFVNEKRNNKMRKKNHKRKEWKMRYYARIMNIVTRIFCLSIIIYIFIIIIINIIAIVI